MQTPEQHLVARQYELIDIAMEQQRAFASRSLTTEGMAAIGEQWGLHDVDDPSEVDAWLREGAPISGVAKIAYGDGLTHWETPLLTALIDERMDGAIALLNRGADPDAPNAVTFPAGGGFAHTALHMMAQRGLNGAAYLLISAGADVNRRTTMGTTPLHFAAGKDNVELVRTLLRAGADPSIREFNDDAPGGLGDRPIDQAGPRTRALLSPAADNDSHPRELAPPLTSTPPLPGFNYLDLLGMSDALRTFAQAVPRGEFGYALRIDGTVVKWETRIALVSDMQEAFEPVRFVKEKVPVADVVSISGGGRGGGSFFAMKADGSLWEWGEDSLDAEIPSRVDALPPVASVITNDGGSTRLALTQGGQVWTWGDGYGGLLGDGTDKSRATPAPIDGLDGVTDLRIDGHGCYALSEDGAVWAWGRGHLDDYDAPTRVKPERVRGLPQATSIGEGRSAIDANGGVWTWDEALTGTKVADLVGDPVQIVASYDHFAPADAPKATYHALLPDGSVWAWGANHLGQVGIGGTAPARAPVELSGLTEVVSLVSTVGECFALRADGSVWAWGGMWSSVNGAPDKYASTPSPINLSAPRDAPTFKKWGSVRVSGLGSDRLRDQMWDLREGRTMLMMLAAAGMDGSGRSMVDEIALMLEQGSDPDEADSDGDTALYYAASKGNLEVVEMLLAAGADPNASAGTGGVTPLLLAAKVSVPMLGFPPVPGKSSLQYQEIAIALLRAGADPHQMYDHNLELCRSTERGMLMILLEHVPTYLGYDDLRVVYRVPGA